jgi:hypothetical protein
MDDDGNSNRQWQQWIAIALAMGLHGDLHLRALQRWRVEKENEFFFFYFVFFYYYSFLLLELLQGLFTTWLQAQKHIWVHSLNANLKTHVQINQMYVGLHHLVQIL